MNEQPEANDSTPKAENPVAFVAGMLKQLGKEEGIPVDIEPRWGYVGRITRTDGRFTYFRGTNFDLNGMGSMEIARDKGYAAHFLHQQGYNVIPGKTFFSPTFADTLKTTDSYDAAYNYAKELGFPVIVKPNSMSQGRGVSAAHDKRTLMQAMHRIAKIDRVFLVQQFVKGHDYRVVVLDGDIISAYERLPLTIVGDGISTITQLLDAKQIEFHATGRDTSIKKDDDRIDLKLKREGLSRSSVLPSGVEQALLDNRNLSTGGESVDVTSDIHPSYKTLCSNITRDMGLRYCGVDLMIDGDIRLPVGDKNNYVVIEINAAPGIDNYAKSGDSQKLIVAEMYRRILRALAGIE